MLRKEELKAIDAAEPYEAGLGIALDEARELARQLTKACMSINRKPKGR